MTNQALAGASVWLTASAGDPGATLFVTVLSALFAVGALTNLLPDSRAVLLSVPLLMGQIILYWATEGARGLSIALSLSLVLLLMIRFATAHGRSFARGERLRAKNAVMAMRAQLARIEAERMRAEQSILLAQVRAALSDASAANRAKAQFLAAASHDLRQPLYAIQLLADTLRLHDLQPDADAIVEQQQRAIASLRTLFDNLLDLSRFESGEIELRRVEVGIDQIFDPLDAEFMQQCAERGLKWRVVCPPVVIVTDPVILTRLLRNLLSNAVRYTVAGSVELGAALDGERVRLWVNDSGIGIAPENHEHVFKEFVQLPNKLRSNDKGVGLGLAIARHAANALGSTLSLRSAVGEGTRFTLFLRNRVDRCTASIEKVDALAQPIPCPSSMMIWLIEDDHFVLDALDRTVRKLGVNCRLIASPTEFRALLDTGEVPDAAIFDDMLGEEESGLDLAIDLSKRHPRTRIMIATANTRPERLRLIDSSHFTRFQKPLTSQQIIKWLREGQNPVSRAIDLTSA